MLLLRSSIASGVVTEWCGLRLTAASQSSHFQLGPQSTWMPFCHLCSVVKKGCTLAQGWGCIKELCLPCDPTFHLPSNLSFLPSASGASSLSLIGGGGSGGALLGVFWSAPTGARSSSFFCLFQACRCTLLFLLSAAVFLRTVP